MRIVDNDRDIYTDLLAEESLQALCPGAGIDYDSVDWIATGHVLNTSTHTLIGKKVNLARLFDRSWLHRNQLLTQHYGRIPLHVLKNPRTETSEVWIQNNHLSWCQTCTTQSVENRAHWLAECPSPEARRIRREWLENLHKYTFTKLPHLHNHLARNLVIAQDGIITYHDSTQRASLLMAGHIPKQWWLDLYNREERLMTTPPTEHDRKILDSLGDKYKRFLTWHGKQFLNHLWRPMTKLRQDHYERRGEDREIARDVAAMTAAAENILPSQSSANTT